MARVPFGRRASTNIGPIPAAAASPSVDTSLAVTAVQALPKNAPKPAENTRKRDAAEPPKVVSVKKLKQVVADGSPSLAASTFGSLADETYSEKDVQLLKERDEKASEIMLKAALGEAFYHGLRTLSHKNTLIKDQDRALKKLKAENQSLGAKLGEASKKTEGEIAVRDGEIAKLKEVLKKTAEENEQVVESLNSELSKARGEIKTFRASSAKEQDDWYTEGFLDYLRNFIAGDPGYDWSVHFPPSTPTFVENFIAENTESIKRAKEDLRKQFEDEAKKASAGGNTSAQGETGDK